MAEGATSVQTAQPFRAAAALLADAVVRLDPAVGSVRLAIPGGSALAALPEARRRMGPVWSRVRLTWVDERCVPFAHPESNRGRAHRSGAR